MNKNALPMFTRRSLMLTSAMLAGGAALGGLSRGAAAQAKDMDMWYWGEQELPGLQKYVNDSVAKYTAANVKPMLQDTAVVISQFQTAAAAGNAPDVQYLWNGIYHMESVWLGYLRGLNSLIKPEVIAASNPTLLSHFGGDIGENAKIRYAADYSATYKGVYRLFPLHVTLGHGLNPRSCMSIYFDWDPVAQKLILARYGRHGRGA